MVYCVQVPDGVHVPVAVRVLHYRGVRGARRNRPLLHGNCGRHLVRHRILFKVYVFCQFIILITLPFVLVLIQCIFAEDILEDIHLI